MSTSGPAVIELRLRELAQLFNSLDPSPFLERDLDADAEEFIASWAVEIPMHRELSLVIHLATPPTTGSDAEEAVQAYFRHRAEHKQREFTQLLRRGRVSLLVGVLFLVACLSVAGLLPRLLHASVASVIKESLTIIGWVALWRPLEIYLYDWWPVRSERRNLQRLARMQVKVIVPQIPL
ncbi:MAG: hypothetical protein H7343_09615 [Undibacterium sp.]|nr:hypothetical protein [Opitutaceae bacterium]